MIGISERLTAALEGRYTLERELGQGGMATVYLADDARHRRKVAVKVLRPELAATIGPERFLREIEIAAQLQHPHILPLLDSGEADGFLYYVMPFVDGQSLRERLGRQGELPVNEALKLLVEIVDALSYAHARGVVHRDVKPDNVMLSGRHALVLDFGVAKAVSEASGRNQLTTAGVALGTPAYMAPEQAVADPHLDHRVDIYAVGVMAYELLAGRAPFIGGTPQQVLAAHVTQAPDPLSRHRPGISPVLEAIVMRCLAKRPADRWQSADELLSQLEPLVTSSGGLTPTSTRPVAGWRPERHAGRWIAAAAAGVAIAAVLWKVWPTARPRAPVNLDRVQVTFTGNTWAPSISPDGKRIAFAERQCDSAGICAFDLVVQDAGGAGSTRILRGATNMWSTEWTADGRFLLVGGAINDSWGSYSVPMLGGEPRLLGQGLATLIGNGDTTLIVFRSARDTVAWFRRVGTGDGVVYDSVPFRAPPGDYPLARVTADGRWLVVLTAREQSRILTIADRGGRIRDSLVFPHNRVWQAFPIAGTNAIGVASGMEGVGDANDLIVYRIDETGRLTGAADTVAHQLDVDWLDMGRGGELLIGAGPAEYSVSSFRWEPFLKPAFPLRHLAVSTTISVTGGLSPDGRQVMLARSVIRNGRVLRQLSLMSSDSGAERALGSPRDIVDWDLGEREIFIGYRRHDSVVVATLDPATGGSRDLRAYPADEYGGVEASAPGGFVMYTPLGDRIRRVLAPGLPDTTFATPPTFGHIMDAEPSPDGRAVAIVGWDAREDSILVFRMSLVDGSTTRLATLTGEGADALRWLPDGSLIVPVRETAQTIALYRLSTTTGPPQRLGLLPRFSATYRFSADGRRGIVRARESKTDLHIIRNFRELVGH